MRIFDKLPFKHKNFDIELDELQIDKIDGQTVFIIKSGDSWFVVWDGLFLGAVDQGFQESPHPLSNLEAALTAYDQWKQQLKPNLKIR